MILTDPQTGTSVNAWGWLNRNGQACGQASATHRLWKCYGHSNGHFDGKVAYIALPLETEDNDVLTAAVRLFGHSAWEGK